MKQKRSIAVFMAVILVLLCCACSGPEETDIGDDRSDPQDISGDREEENSQNETDLTAEQVAQQMQKALSETPCGKAELVMSMDIFMDAGENGTMDMTVENTTTITICQSPVSSYTVAVSDMSFGGENSQTVTENYCIAEGGEIISYVNSGGVWMKLPTGQTGEELAVSASAVSVDLKNVSIDDTVNEYNGRNAVCLTTQLTGEALQNSLSGMLDSIGGEGGALGEAADTAGAADYSALTCDVRIYLDPETYLPMAEEMTFSGMSEVLSPLYAETGITVDVSSCTGTGTFISYEPQEPVILPEGAAEKAEAWTRLLSGEPDNGDGSFTIREGTVLIDVIPSDGFELSEKDYDHIRLEREDHRSITYTMYYLSGTDMTGSAFAAMIDSNASRYQTNGGTVNRQQLTLSTDTLEFYCDLLGLTWGSGREEADFYAWSPLGNDGSGTYYLLVEITDGYNDGFGNSKSADITPDELKAYLNAAAPGKLMS